MINQVVIVGRLGKEPELEVKGQNQMLRISIATDDGYKGKDGNWVDQTEWHNVTIWNKQAEYVAKYAAKGAVVMVQGSMKTRKWQDQNGNDRYDYHIEPRLVKVLTPKKVDGQAPPSSRGGHGAPPPGEDDLPF